GLTVTSVTYGQTSPQWVPIPQSLDLMEYYDIAYDYQNNQYAVVWQGRTEENQSELNGVLLSEANLAVETEYASLVISETYSMMPSLTSDPALEQVMLSFTTGRAGNEYIVMIPFGEVYSEPPQHFFPRISYDPENDQFILLSSQFVDID